MTVTAALLRGCMALLGLLLAAREAPAIEGLPGSTWGFVADSSSELTGSGGMGWINQGIDWVALPGDVVVNTYAEYRIRQRSRQQEYFNSRGPVLGLELKRSSLRLGVAAYWETLTDYPGGPQDSTIRETYLSGFYDWNLATVGGRRLPGSAWFFLSHNINGLTGDGGMGWINQGIDWYTLPGGAVLATYAEYRYRARTKLDDYFDAHGPVVGCELKKTQFRLGMDYSWQQYPLLNERSNAFELYFSWYLDWNLMKGKQ